MDETIQALVPGTTLAGRYEVVRCINSGGMGAVYEVLDANTARRLALKTIRPGIVPTTALLERFQREARITSEIESEHIVKILDFGVDEASDTAFLTMDLLKGKDLREVLRDEGPLSPRRVAHSLWQVAIALGNVHEAGVVHRDLKPENLFLTRRDDGHDLIKILDFGVAKATREGLTTTGLVGTPLYMAPEQIRGEAPDERSDIYALGQVAFTLLTGHPYLEPGRIKEPPSQRAQRFGVTLPDAFDDWFRQATAYEMSERFDTAVEMVAELAAVLSISLPRPVPGVPSSERTGEPAEPNPSTMPVSAESSVWFRPRRRLQMLMATVLLAGGAWLGAKRWFPAQQVRATLQPAPSSALPLPQSPIVAKLPAPAATTTAPPQPEPRAVVPVPVREAPKSKPRAAGAKPSAQPRLPSGSSAASASDANVGSAGAGAKGALDPFGPKH